MSQEDRVEDTPSPGVGTTSDDAYRASIRFIEAVEALGLSVRSAKPWPLDAGGHGVRVGLMSTEHLDRITALLRTCCVLRPVGGDAS